MRSVELEMSWLEKLKVACAARFVCGWSISCIWFECLAVGRMDSSVQSAPGNQRG